MQKGVKTMDFNDTKEEAQFREEVNNWLSKNAEKKLFINSGRRSCNKSL